METVHATPRTELVQLHPVRIVAPVLFRVVRPLMTLGASEVDELPDVSAFLRQTSPLGDLGDDTGADRPAALADGEVQALFNGHGVPQRDMHLDIVPWHDHLDTLG